MSYKHLTDAQILEYKRQGATLKAPKPSLEVGYSIIRSLSKSLSDEEWVGLYRGVKLDVLPLSPKQLEAARGGFIGLFEGQFPLPFPNPLIVEILD